MRMDRRVAAAALLALLAAPNPGLTDDAQDMLLVVGEQRVLDAADVASFSESAKGVIEVKVPKDGRKLVVTALKPGQTSLLLITGDGGQRTHGITVFARRPETIEEEVRALTRDLGELSLRRLGPRIFIEGAVPSEAELARVERIAKVYAGQVESLARVGEGMVRPRANIRLDLTFVELRASSGSDFGMGWPAQIGGTQSVDVGYDMVTGTPSASYQVVGQALPALNAAALSGHARIRKRATLVTTSGAKASYSAGGEVNVAVAGSQAAELRSVPYGCKLTVLPRLAPGPGLLDLEVDAEVSDLTETTQDVPGRTISRVQTLVHLGLGQSIMLSGLDAESETRSRSGFPLLSSIPIVGYFFGAATRRDERVEGLIVITPAVLDHVSRDARRLLDEALERFEKFDGDFGK
jgi:pilus assembly protein CpaC